MLLDDFYQDPYISNNILDTRTVLKAVTKNLINNKWNLLSTDNIATGKFEKNKKTLGVNFVHCDKIDSDFVITDSISCNLNKNNRIISLSPIIFGNYFCNFQYQNQKPKKLFNCFIRRGCSTRQSWFFWLIRKNLVDQGNLTFWFQNRDFSINNLSEQQYFEYCYKNNESVFAEEYNFFHKNYTLPFKNFTSDIETAIIDSQKTLTIETYFSSENLSIFSEKTWRTIQLPRPFLLFSTPNNVKLLREWGFEVYDDYIDHSYDQEHDWIKRQSLILEQLDKPIEYTDSVLEDFEQRAVHNRNLLKNYKQQWPDYFSKFLDQLKNL